MREQAALFPKNPVNNSLELLSYTAAWKKDMESVGEEKTVLRAPPPVPLSKVETSSSSTTTTTTTSFPKNNSSNNNTSTTFATTTATTKSPPSPSNASAMTGKGGFGNGGLSSTMGLMQSMALPRVVSNVSALLESRTQDSCTYLSNHGHNEEQRDVGLTLEAAGGAAMGLFPRPYYHNKDSFIHIFLPNNTSTMSSPSSSTTSSPMQRVSPTLTMAANAGHNDRSVPATHKQQLLLPALKPQQASAATTTTTNSNIKGAKTSFLQPKVASGSNPSSKVKELQSENERLRTELDEKNRHIQALEAKVQTLSKHVDEFRQLPTGKISQIPIPDMLELMKEYGSEVSETVATPRSCTTGIQKASIIRQFRRWNPNFFQFFERKNGKWMPKLGKQAELDRRAKARRRANGGHASSGSSTSSGSSSKASMTTTAAAKMPLKKRVKKTAN